MAKKRIKKALKNALYQVAEGQQGLFTARQAVQLVLMREITLTMLNQEIG